MEEINPKIIAVILRHYFCNIEHLVTDDQILSYYFTLLDYVNKDEDIDWDEIGSDYIIWHPYEHVNPSDIVSNMENLYTDMFNTFKLSTSNITVNVCEAYSEIADLLVKEEFEEQGLSSTYEENKVLYYNDDAQEIFNEYADKIEKVLLDIKL